MSMWLWLLALVGSFIMAAVGDMVSEEIRGWLDVVPQAILRLAAAQLNETQRDAIYENEWLPELSYVLRGAESRPITRLIRGISFALGLLVSAHRVAQQLTRGSPSVAPIRRPFIHRILSRQPIYLRGYRYRWRLATRALISVFLGILINEKIVLRLHQRDILSQVAKISHEGPFQ
jgi:hypothetical protein